MLSASIDYVSANAGGTLTGDAQGAVDTVYNISGSIISGTRSNKNFTATNVDNIKINNTTIGKNNTITTDHAGLPWDNWSIGKDFVHLGPEFMPDFWQQYQRVYLDKTGLSSMSGTILDKKLIWKAILNTDIEGINNTITAINGSALAVGDEFPISADEAIQYVQTNSGKIDTVSTTVQTNSADWTNETISSYTTATIEGVNAINSLNGKPIISFRTQSAQEAGVANYATKDDLGRDITATYLTAHQAISAEEWNDCYDNVNTNSGAWGGSALPISAGPGIKVNLVDNTLVFSNDETVLYSGERTSACVLSENPTNFYRIRVEDFYHNLYEFAPSIGDAHQEIKLTNYTGQPQQLFVQFSSTNDTLYVVKGFQTVYSTWDNPGNATWTATNINNTYSREIITSVTGINRKQ
jgi:hypothetical protein